MRKSTARTQKTRKPLVRSAPKAVRKMIVPVRIAAGQKAVAPARKGERVSAAFKAGHPAMRAGAQHSVRTRKVARKGARRTKPLERRRSRSVPPAAPPASAPVAPAQLSPSELPSEISPVPEPARSSAPTGIPPANDAAMNATMAPASPGAEATIPEQASQPAPQSAPASPALQQSASSVAHDKAWTSDPESDLEPRGDARQARVVTAEPAAADDAAQSAMQGERARPEEQPSRTANSQMNGQMSGAADPNGNSPFLSVTEEDAVQSKAVTAAHPADLPADIYAASEQAIKTAVQPPAPQQRKSAMIVRVRRWFFPVGDAEVLLLKDAACIKQDITDMHGVARFSDLADGQYSVVLNWHGASRQKQVRLQGNAACSYFLW